MAATTVFKHRDGTVPNLLAIGYATAGHLLGLVMLAADGWTVRLCGVGLVVHTLMIGAYLLHDCIHETIFASHRANARLGTLLTWMAGGQWAGWEALRTKHLHHHADRMDPTTWDFHRFLAGAPRPLRGLVLGLEWLHVPAVEIMLRVESVLRPFVHPAWRHERRRMLATLAVWTAGMLVALAFVPVALALYALSYVLFVVALRVFDAFHHTFDLVVVPDYDTPYAVPAEHDRAYEHDNTYSNVVLPGRPWSNLLVLNFAYHNAHHAKPGVPWHRLPALDRRLYGEHPRQERAIAGHLRDFHRFRLRRLAPGVGVGATRGGRPLNVGAVGVSLLTL